MIYARRLSCYLLVAVMMVASLSIAEEKVNVETLTGTRYGYLQEINNQQLIFTTHDDRVTIPLTEVLQLLWERSTPIKVAASEEQGEVMFTDGSIVPFARWKIESANLSLELSGKGSGAVSAPLSSVRCWRLPGMSTVVSEAQWQSACGQNLATDVLVLRRRDSESINRIEGIIKACDAEAVRFEYEGETVSVPWERVYGLIFFRQATPQTAGDIVVVHGPKKLRLSAEQWEADTTRLRLSYGERRVELALDRVRRIDFSAGKIQQLSEAPVVESEWKPYLLSATTGGPPQRNAAFDGGPLRLRFPDERVAGVWRVQSFEEGWALRSKSRLVLELEPWARQLRGWVGIDPATAATGTAEVTILAGDKQLLTFQVDGHSEPVEISLSVDGVRQLTLLVDYGENLDTGDNVHFVDLRVTR